MVQSPRTTVNASSFRICDSPLAIERLFSRTRRRVQGTPFLREAGFMLGLHAHSGARADVVRAVRFEPVLRAGTGPTAGGRPCQFLSDAVDVASPAGCGLAAA